SHDVLPNAERDHIVLNCRGAQRIAAAVLYVELEISQVHVGVVQNESGLALRAAICSLYKDASNIPIAATRDRSHARWPDPGREGAGADIVEARVLRYCKRAREVEVAGTTDEP